MLIRFMLFICLVAAATACGVKAPPEPPLDAEEPIREIPYDWSEAETKDPTAPKKKTP